MARTTSYLRLNKRLLPLNVLMIAGALVWAGCASDDGTKVETVPPAARPPVATTPYTPPTTVSPLVAQARANGWTPPLVQEFAEGFESTYGPLDEFGSCFLVMIMATYTPTQIENLADYGEAEMVATLRPLAEYCAEDVR